MTVARIAVSFDPVLAKQVRRAAGKETISSWLADAAGRKLRAEGLLGVIADWETEHGPLTLEKEARPKKATSGKRSR